MAQSRGKSARGKSGSRAKAGKRPVGGGSPLWPWLVALVVVGGGLAAYENSAALRGLLPDLKGGKPAQVAARPALPSEKPASDKSVTEKSVPEGPVPPKSIASAPPRPMPPRTVTPPDNSHTAAIIPPAPIGKPMMDAAEKPAEALRSGEKLAGGYEAKFFLCGTAKQDDCVVSADRFVFHGQKIRLVGIEVPDIKTPRCEDERIKASDAELRVRAFLDSGPFELVTWQGNDAEVDGHKLREVKRNGMSLADVLVREGLAKRPGSGKGGWCS